MNANAKAMRANKQLLRAMVLPFWALRFFYYVIKEYSWAFLRFYLGYHESNTPSKKALKTQRESIFLRTVETDDLISVEPQSRIA